MGLKTFIEYCRLRTLIQPPSRVEVRPIPLGDPLYNVLEARYRIGVVINPDAVNHRMVAPVLNRPSAAA